MAIQVAKFEASFPGRHDSPQGRACRLAYSGLDYLRALVLVVESPDYGPMTSFLLPAMHQTLELLTKAIAFKADPAFTPKKYSHRTFDLMRDYAKNVPVFASMLSEPGVLDILDGLEKAYCGVRYGECVWRCDGDDWQLFRTLAERLLDEMHTLTGVKFLANHHDAQTEKNHPGNA